MSLTGLSGISGVSSIVGDSSGGGASFPVNTAVASYLFSGGTLAAEQSSLGVPALTRNGADANTALANTDPGGGTYAAIRGDDYLSLNTTWLEANVDGFAANTFTVRILFEWITGAPEGFKKVVTARTKTSDDGPYQNVNTAIMYLTGQNDAAPLVSDTGIDSFHTWTYSHNTGASGLWVDGTLRTFANAATIADAGGAIVSSLLWFVEDNGTEEGEHNIKYIEIWRGSEGAVAAAAGQPNQATSVHA